MAKKAKAVVVTTEHRGVFVGYLVSHDEELHTTTIKKARLCLRWDEKTKGFMGLAATGPIGSSSRIGPSVPSITLQKVTSVMECSPEATKRWELAPW